MARNDFQYEGWILTPSLDGLDIKHFDCGDKEMNFYFQRKSAKYRRQLLVQSYHFCPKDYTESDPIMLVDLCNDVVCRKLMPQDAVENIHRQKRYLETFPAVKIARLGRNVKFRGQNMAVILFNALKCFFTRENRTGCRFLTLDAYRSRVPLYKNCGFIETLAEEQGEEHRTVSMLFDLLPFVPSDTSPARLR